MKRLKLWVLFILLSSQLLVPALGIQQKITSPMEQFGHNIGDDYWLATYAQLVDYWKILDQESDRMQLVEIGKTSEGRTMFMAIITAPENIASLNRYKDISRRLALAEGLSDEDARQLASEGKAVVWIDGGMHATETAGSQQELELVYQMVSRSDAETLRILDNVILLTLVTNPDGMDMIGEWYMRHSAPEKRSTRDLPFLYQKYVGHDNNRDYYMINMTETEVVCRIMYHEWFPQIVYNHHQSGPAGAVLFAPPFRDPFSYNFDPLLPLGIQTVGTAMHSRFVAEGKPGSTMREGAWYQTWWNGCLRCTPYFHNMIGILTEIIGNPTPMEIPFLPDKHLPDSDYPYPIAPQKWHFRQTIDYCITADRAILDLAAKLKENFLYNIYRMGKNSIERGMKDSWTVTPVKIQAVEEAIKKDKAKMVGSGRDRGYPPEYYDKVLHAPEARDPRGFIIPSDQPDFLTAVKFINCLIKTGIQVHKATEDFGVAGKKYPAGSLVVKTNQAFRPHVIDMFEPQFYPDDIAYPGGPPRPPYDSAGYTLAFQMGVQFDRILDGFNGPFEKLDGFATPPEGKLRGDGKAGYVLDHRINDSFVAVNRLLKTGKKVFWLKDPVKIGSGVSFPAGAVYIPAEDKDTGTVISAIASEKGLNFYTLDSPPKGAAFKLDPVRIGVWDEYGGSMASGWVQWLLEQFEFEYKLVYPQELDTGDLKNTFDVLIFVSRAIPDVREDEEEPSPYRRSSGPDPKEIPEKYHYLLGDITAEKTIPQLKAFLDAGGTILTMGSSNNLAAHLKLPIASALEETKENGTIVPLPMTKFFIPGSILSVAVDTSHPLGYGLSAETDVFFNRSPVFRLLPEFNGDSIKSVAIFEAEKSLRSGWAMGQHYLKNGIAVLTAEVGQGKLFMFGPDITFRAQPHGTFKFLFNGIYLGGAENLELD